MEEIKSKNLIENGSFYFFLVDSYVYITFFHTKVPYLTAKDFYMNFLIIFNQTN